MYVPLDSHAAVQRMRRRARFYVDASICIYFKLMIFKQNPRSHRNYASIRYNFIHTVYRRPMDPFDSSHCGGCAYQHAAPPLEQEQRWIVEAALGL